MRYMKRNVLIYGAGLMGRGIAQVYARNPEHTVYLYDIKDNGTMEKIEASLADFVSKGVLTEEDKTAQMARISVVPELTKDFCQTIDIVVEA